MRVGGVSDNGIDLLGTWQLPSRREKLKVILQCKGGSQKISPSLVRELEGSFIGAPVGWRGEGVVAFLFTDDGLSESDASSTASVASSILEYRLENGRTYHKYKDGKYWAPNDERENERLDLVHHLYLRTLDGRLGTAPPNRENSKVGRVLDVGTGTGIWAMDFGEEHPEAEVIGVDLSASQPQFVPPNVFFEIDDVEESWTFSRPFDYIHSRMMKGSIRDWKKFLEQCYESAPLLPWSLLENLNPGGYLELNDVDLFPVSDDDTLKDDGGLLKAFRLFLEALEKLGSSFDSQSTRFKEMLAEVGFEDIQIEQFKWPTNTWPKHAKFKEIGYWNYENLAPNLDGIMMAPLTRVLGWEKDAVHLLAMEARKELGDKNVHAYFNVWSIHGRKPLKA
ncbi:Secondary metabolism regulator LAE1 [Colletotrichum sidae]|uniref:Secondary metabolism regulator LAE1 n=1 Tax=Colletotrichum sidae TaxID=1347389 RepID=A0A4V3I420_9PEZI|nr:Secondary metabolism regulator LAE1 [Colletotrichum sidae]